MAEDLPKTELTRAKRLRERAAYDRATLNAILDAQPLAHVGTVIDGRPVVTPTLQWREGDHVYWHGSAASRMLRVAQGRPVCLTVSLLDGWVLARSPFHHSVNYRSVMLFGTPTPVADEEKEARLKVFLEQLFPGRWEGLRPNTTQELKAMTVLRLAIEEGSAKLRTGPPKDDEEDYELPIWAGVIPGAWQAAAPVPDPRNRPGIDMPEALAHFRLNRGEPPPR